MTKYKPQLGDYVVDIENEEQFEAVIAKWKELTGKDRYDESVAYKYFSGDESLVLGYDYEGDIVIEDLGTALSNNWIYKEVSVKDIVPELFKSKPISPEDELTFTASAKEWAKVYALLGITNGSYGSNLFDQLRSLLDPVQENFDSCEFLSDHEIIKFIKIEDEWLDSLFAEHKANEQLESQKKAIQDQIDALQKELESLG